MNKHISISICVSYYYLHSLVVTVVGYVNAGNTTQPEHKTLEFINKIVYVVLFYVVLLYLIKNVVNNNSCDYCLLLSVLIYFFI